MNNARIVRERLGRIAGLAAAVLLLAWGPADGAEPALKVGDPAPPFQPGRWLRGEPLAQLPPKRPAVLIFWDHDHPFHRAGLQRLDAMREKLKGREITFAGVYLANSAAFDAASARKLGEHFSLPLAADLRDEQGRGKMAAAWLDAAGQDALPAVFVLEPEGRVAWMGHPYGLTEKLLLQVADGTFDLARAKAAYAEALRNEPALAEVWQALRDSLEEESNWDQAFNLLDRMEKLAHPDSRPGLGVLRFQMFLAKGDAKSAAQLAVQLSDAYPDEPSLQNTLAWEWATNDDFEKPDYAAIEKIARRASAAAYERDAAILDTLARALFLNGRKDEATRQQERAVILADEEQRPQLQRALECYRRGVLPAVHE